MFYSVTDMYRATDNILANAAHEQSYIVLEPEDGLQMTASHSMSHLKRITVLPL
jgi:hypothetical protein